MKNVFESIRRLLTVIKYGTQIFCIGVFFSDSLHRLEDWGYLIALLIGLHYLPRVILWIIAPIFIPNHKEESESSE